MPRGEKPNPADKPSRVLVTGLRKAGDSSYHFKIVGNRDSRFPPLMIKMSLHEMQQWLHEMQRPALDAQHCGRPGLRVVS